QPTRCIAKPLESTARIAPLAPNDSGVGPGCREFPGQSLLPRRAAGRLIGASPGCQMYPSRDWSLNVDPVWTGSYSLLGIVVPALAAVIVIGLTIWTYSGVQPLWSWRVRLVLALRLAALACAFLMAVRPAITVTDELQSATTLLVLADNSESMSL